MRNRIALDMTKEQVAAVDEIAAATGRSRTDVVRDSLEFYDLIISHLIAGERVYLGANREVAAEVLLPQLVRARGRQPSATPSLGTPQNTTSHAEGGTEKDLKRARTG